MMTNGFAIILGGIVSGKVVMYTPKTALPTGRPVWRRLIFAGYSMIMAFAFMAMFNINTFVSRQARNGSPLICKEKRVARR